MRETTVEGFEANRMIDNHNDGWDAQRNTCPNPPIRRSSRHYVGVPLNNQSWDDKHETRGAAL
jgi:hypothetical protein